MIDNWPCIATAIPHISIPMAMPMIIVGLMMGAIFSVITAIGAEMSGGGFGLGSKLTTFSSTLRTAEFFAVILILAVLAATACAPARLATGAAVTTGQVVLGAADMVL